MRQEQVKRMLADYRRCAARRDSLRAEIELAEWRLEQEKAHTVEQSVLPGRGFDVPPGGGPGDPTARLAVRIAGGWQPRYLLDMAGEIDRMRAEFRECEAVCRCVDAWRGALSDRERLIIDLCVIGAETYTAALDALEQQGPAAITSRSSLKRIKQSAMEKIYAAAGA